MGTKGGVFAGLSVAMVTPFKDGAIDYELFAEQIEFQIAAGTHMLCPVGTTGESPTLSHQEHDRVIAFVCETVAGRIKVMPGTGSNSTSEALRLTKFAEKVGADAALQVAPYYNKPTQQGFYEHFKCLAELENIDLVKEATGSLDQASAILTNTNLTVLSGDDSLTLPLMSVGAEGVISVVGNIVPEDMSSLIQACSAGNLVEAQRWHHRLFPLCRDMLGIATNPIPVKTAMKILGRDSGELRLPMTPLAATEEVALNKTLAAYGLGQHAVV